MAIHSLSISEDISGIFIKSIAKGSVADLCGQIRVHDQVVEVRFIKFIVYYFQSVIISKFFIVIKIFNSI